MRKKINSLCSNYRKELRKVSYSISLCIGNGDVYQQKCWTFNDLSLLSKLERYVSLNVSSAIANQEVS
jgi:hypothetical protein